MRIFVAKGDPVASRSVSFDVDEDHEFWPDMQRWIVARRALDICRTVFSKEEVSAAKWLQLLPDWHRGYPQPREDHFGYLQATYDLSEYCEKCGVGNKQNAPFQMRGEPKWGRNEILQLNWVFDEFFVTPRLWRAVFQPRGVGYRSVKSVRGSELQTVCQLLIDEQVRIVADDLSGANCTSCDRMKYLPVTRGCFPPLATEPTGHVARTTQDFGSGASAHKGIIVSGELARALLAEEVRGASMRPVGDR